MTFNFGRLAARLPSLDWTLAHLAGVWARDGEMINCPLPGHNDDTPSFNLWAADSEGIPQRFGCFGCGRGGSVLELVMELENLDLDQALLRGDALAELEALDSTIPERTKAKTVLDLDLDYVLAQAKAAMDAQAIGVLQRYTASKGISSESLETFAIDELEWVPQRDGRILIPHRDGSGNLTGIKIRTASGKKWSEDGSEYGSLYGSWRDRSQKQVLLCEGESDALLAMYSLGDNIDVLALPSGVDQKIQDEWTERLKDRELILALDGDEAGRRGTSRWLQARPDALIIRLPRDEDLVSCGEPIEDLISRAEPYRQDMGSVGIGAMGFERIRQNGNVPIADFSFVPELELATEDGPAWEVLLGRRLELIRASDLHSSSTMRRWAGKRAKSWVGKDHDAQSLLNWVAYESALLPLELATSKAGKIGRSYVGPGFCIGPEKLRYAPPRRGDAKLGSRIRIQPGEVNPATIEALEQLNRPDVMATILGWLCATLMRGSKPPCPPLFVSGESGAGKTSLLQGVLNTFGFGIEADLTSTTPYGVDCMINSCIGFPVWLDEYRRGARYASMQRLQQLLRSAYFGHPSMKGGMGEDPSELNEVTTLSGIVVSGEMGSDETSLRDRMVVLDLDPGARNQEAMATVQKFLSPGLGHELLSFMAARPDVLFQIQQQGAPDLPERYRVTLGFVQAGWDIWNHFRWEQGIRTKAVPPNLQDLAGVRTETEDPWMQAIKACEGVPATDGNWIVQQNEEGVTLIPIEVTMKAKQMGIELPARSQEMVSWLKRRWTVEDVRLVGRRRAIEVKGLTL